MAYNAVVCKISTRELPGLDRIQLGTCCGYSVIVSKDVQDGQLGLFFEAGGQLSEEFCDQNDLLRRKLDDGTDAGGYFEPNRRVKAIKMRGIKSEGFWIPLSSLNYTNSSDKLAEGNQFSEINTHPICNKYFTPETLRRVRGGQRSNYRSETLMFRKHIETESLRKCLPVIPADAILYLSEKLHGTSGRYGRILDERPPEGFREKCVAFLERVFRVAGDWRDWCYLNGSRNIILERRNGVGFYGREQFRFNSTRAIRLRKGETLYYELVGYTEDGKPIMNPQDTASLKDKEVEKKFGKRVIYDYGCSEGECALYVYHITMTNEDGSAVEYSWPQVVQRCKELGLKTVPVIACLIYNGDAEELLKRVDLVVNGDNGTTVFPSRLDPKHPMEGVVVRYESDFGTGWLKHKSWGFGVMEGYLRNDDQLVDMEEVA